MRQGTSYFPTYRAAQRYYAYEAATLRDICRKVQEGLIHIGQPALKPGQRLVLIDEATRYAIEEDSQ